MTRIEAHRDRLLQCMESLESCAVAFSGGVDSSVVAKAAHVVLGQRAVAVTGVSASLAAGDWYHLNLAKTKLFYLFAYFVD